ncbi:MAG: alpha/beta fold hydrolase [Planctomycetia bacterium]|nr:alpha/beta fold hydrolase [Planctomycetia bacterium]
MIPLCADGDDKEASRAVSVQFLDANPQFLRGAELPLESRDDLLPLLPRLAECPERSGAVTDGLSVLLVKVEVPAAGTVRLSLDAHAPAGKLSAAAGKDARVDRLPTQAVDNRHVAVALYTPPDEFGEKHTGENVGSRNVRINVEFRPAAGDALRHTATLKLVRPPVVLVHGTYHNPKVGWETRPPREIGRTSMVEHLESRGFRVFLCDYGRSNGDRRAGPSHFRDNQMAVWKNKGGIREALEALREEGVAVTQVDVVGHSMGGTLARVYARGRPMPDPDGKPDPAGKPETAPAASGNGSGDAGTADGEANWYLRADNFHRGDIRRLTTICTPHFGCEIVKLVGLYPECCRRVPELGETEKAKAILELVDMAHGIRTGAFCDQAPCSEALCAIGPTRIPSHAIAGVSAPADFSQFNQLYRWNFLTIYLTAPPELVQALFTHENVAQDENARRLVEFQKEHPQLIQGLALRATLANLGRPPSKVQDPKTDEQYTRALSMFCEAVFCGQPHDGTVTEQSAHGGLKRGEARTTIQGVVHSFAPRYPAVQKRVLDLLEGPASAFDPEGFPAAGKPAHEPKRR